MHSLVYYIYSYYPTHTHPYIYTGVKYLPLYDTANFIKLDADVILIAVSIISFEDVVRSLPVEMLKGKLIVDVLSVKVSVCYVLCAYLSDVYMCHYLLITTLHVFLPLILKHILSYSYSY